MRTNGTTPRARPRVPRSPLRKGRLGRMFRKRPAAPTHTPERLEVLAGWMRGPAGHAGGPNQSDAPRPGPDAADIAADDAYFDQFVDHDIDFDDTDIATVDDRPAQGRGRFYLGFQSSEYLEDPDASEPTDIDAEAASFATWARRVLGVPVTAAQVRHVLADAADAEPRDDIAEETVERLVNLLGLPLPEELRGTADRGRGLQALQRCRSAFWSWRRSA